MEWFSIIWCLAWTFAVHAEIPEIVNLKEISPHLKLAEFKAKPFARPVKIAILDSGFHGYESEIGKTLPANTVYRKGAENPELLAKGIQLDDENKSIHGLFMAQIVAKVIESSEAKAQY